MKRLRNGTLGLVGLLALTLGLGACETAGGVTDVTEGGDTQTLSTDTEAPPASGCPGFIDVVALANQACSEEGLSCHTSMAWCGGTASTGGCDCVDGTWRCFAAGRPAICHECCQQANGEGWFCGQAGACFDMSGCGADACCVPGPGGNGECQSVFGDCSLCEPTSGDFTVGRCSSTSCE